MSSTLAYVSGTTSTTTHHYGGTSSNGGGGGGGEVGSSFRGGGVEKKTSSSAEGNGHHRRYLTATPTSVDDGEVYSSSSSETSATIATTVTGSMSSVHSHEDNTNLQHMESLLGGLHSQLNLNLDEDSSPAIENSEGSNSGSQHKYHQGGHHTSIPPAATENRVPTTGANVVSGTGGSNSTRDAAVPGGATLLWGSSSSSSPTWGVIGEGGGGGGNGSEGLKPPVPSSSSLSENNRQRSFSVGSGLSQVSVHLPPLAPPEANHNSSAQKLRKGGGRASPPDSSSDVSGNDPTGGQQQGGMVGVSAPIAAVIGPPSSSSSAAPLPSSFPGQVVDPQVIHSHNHPSSWGGAATNNGPPGVAPYQQQQQLQGRRSRSSSPHVHTMSHFDGSVSFVKSQQQQQHRPTYHPSDHQDSHYVAPLQYSHSAQDLPSMENRAPHSVGRGVVDCSSEHHNHHNPSSSVIKLSDPRNNNNNSNDLSPFFIVGGGGGGQQHPHQHQGHPEGQEQQRSFAQSRSQRPLALFNSSDNESSRSTTNLEPSGWKHHQHQQQGRGEMEGGGGYNNASSFYQGGGSGGPPSSSNNRFTRFGNQFNALSLGRNNRAVEVATTGMERNRQASALGRAPVAAAAPPTGGSSRRFPYFSTQHQVVPIQFQQEPAGGTLWDAAYASTTTQQQHQQRDLPPHRSRSVSLEGAPSFAHVVQQQQQQSYGHHHPQEQRQQGSESSFDGGAPPSAAAMYHINHHQGGEVGRGGGGVPLDLHQAMYHPNGTPFTTTTTSHHHHPTAALMSEASLSEGGGRDAPLPSSGGTHYGYVHSGTTNNMPYDYNVFAANSGGATNNNNGGGTTTSFVVGHGAGMDGMTTFSHQHQHHRTSSIKDARSGSSFGASSPITSTGSGGGAGRKDSFEAHPGSSGGGLNHSLMPTDFAVANSSISQQQPLSPSPFSSASLASTMAQTNQSSLSHIVGNVRRLSRDQIGCRLLQHTLAEEGPPAATVILEELLPHMGDLMMDPFGNYLFQKLMDVLSDEERIVLVRNVSCKLVASTLNLHGTRSVQKIVDVASATASTGAEEDDTGEDDSSSTRRRERLCSMVSTALQPAAARLCIDSHGNHVIQRILLGFPPKHAKFIFDCVAMNVSEVARHRHGCCVIQRCLDAGLRCGAESGETGFEWTEDEVCCNDDDNDDDERADKEQVSVVPKDPIVEARSVLIRKICECALELMQDAYGNYVVQYVLDVCVESSSPDAHTNVANSICRVTLHKVPKLSIQKFSSNVIEKCLEKCSEQMREMLLKEIMHPKGIAIILQDPFGNYVVQRALSVSNHAQAVRLVESMKPHLGVLSVRNTAGGRRIMEKICKRFPNFCLEGGAGSLTTNGNPASSAMYRRGSSSTFNTDMLEDSMYREDTRMMGKQKDKGGKPKRDGKQRIG